MTPDPSHLKPPALADQLTAERAPIRLEAESREAYLAAERWTAIRQRQAAHDGAVVVDAYVRGYLDGMRDEAEGRSTSTTVALHLGGARRW